jgi:uncharacterized membrane protein YfcA
LFPAATDPSVLPLWGELPIAVVIGFTLGLVGGIAGLVLGNLRLPLVFFLLGSAPVAAGTNIGISATSAMAGIIPHWRRGTIQWRVFSFMAPAAIAGGFVGGFYSARVPQGALLLLLSVVVTYGAIGTLRRSRELRTALEGDGAPSAPHGFSIQERSGAMVSSVIGLAVGSLGGLVGLLLGTVRLPTMLRLLRIEPRLAVGTNLAVGLVTGISGLVGHLVGGGVDWELLVTMGVASAVGSNLGARLVGRLSTPALLQAIGMISLAVAGVMFWRAAVEF